jgi:hypothetical protein
MRALVVYESMYGNTHLIAEAIGAGLRAESDDVTVVPVDGATPELVAAAELLVVGGPTHAHGMTSHNSRKAAVDAATKPDSGLEVDPDAEGPGLRDWFATLGTDHRARAAAFDTRFDMPKVLTGQAAKGIRRKLQHHGFDVVADPESFFVTKGDQHLEPDEEERARAWAQELITSDASRSRA